MERERVVVLYTAIKFVSSRMHDFTEYASGILSPGLSLQLLVELSPERQKG